MFPRSFERLPRRIGSRVPPDVIRDEVCPTRQQVVVDALGGAGRVGSGDEAQEENRFLRAQPHLQTVWSCVSNCFALYKKNPSLNDSFKDLLCQHRMKPEDTREEKSCTKNNVNSTMSRRGSQMGGWMREAGDFLERA